MYEWLAVIRHQSLKADMCTHKKRDTSTLPTEGLRGGGRGSKKNPRMRSGSIGKRGSRLHTVGCVRLSFSLLKSVPDLARHCEQGASRLEAAVVHCWGANSEVSLIVWLSCTVRGQGKRGLLPVLVDFFF